ncbi:hypothetical protein UFOVP1131_111 [uncultured Caudovirales phage]|uniref:Uncharacterized protein n=1 Tax=uncultured Caudovirales phage TaxID=2100421 RepID=A0A6J5PR33_9CAUD|nr:hypothetical protein UFOVP966_2 [uncultured Caudovirales phage]CAB4184997.1 hypothetical protein UFOVP1131_111 [uncultured Caudovirales phage]CAB4192744.1 hypothetical protein UFOVP1245_75 [uncultured Caudovirales phage]CAB5231522.1 hypothetical protein UFOVP1582_103 [uncultured Caudovirales phage]
MAKKRGTDLRVTCPNNAKHGELAWHPFGGMVCETCREEHRPRSKTAYRFSVPNFGFLPDDKNEVKE